MGDYQPRQIVYPLKITSLLPKKFSFSSETKLISKFSQILKGNYEISLLGRARIGIHLAAKYAIAESSSRDILLSPFTIPEVVNMVITAGANPVFVDSFDKSFDLDISVLESEIKNRCPAALIVTHYHFNQKRLFEISEICRKYGVLLFEDSAIAMMQSDSDDEKIFSTCKIFSFSAFKTLNYFYGGLIATEDDKFNDFVKTETLAYPRLTQSQYLGQALKTMIYALVTNRLIFSKLTRRIYSRAAGRRVPIAHRKPAPTVIGEIEDSCFSRPSAAAIAELERKVENLVVDCNHRRKISKVYFELLSELVVGSNADVSDIEEGGCFNFPVFLGDNRDSIYFDLLVRGYDVGRHMYDNCHSLSGMEAFSGSSERIEKTRQGLLWLPTHPRITGNYAKKLSEKLLSSLNNLS